MKKINIKKLSKLMIEERKKRGFTQEQFGKITGVNRQIIGRIEQEKVIPSLSQLDKILEILELDFNSIVEESNTDDVFMSMRGEVKTEEEKDGLDKMISMMLCLKKHSQLRRAYYGKESI